MLPNDEAEKDRLDLHHHIFGLTLGGRLFRAPISANPQRVLDFGTGTGIWAVDFADEFPGATVIGTDLSPIQPDLVPPNLRFYVDDVESEWLYSPEQAFDFIHGRGMGGSISDWDELYRQAYQHLRPGGWIEMQEYEAWISSEDDPTLSKCPYTSQWQQLCDEASTKFGRRLNVASEQKQNLIRAGFIDVQDDVYKVRLPIPTASC
jgi:trans-aconitate methyltransferase